MRVGKDIVTMSMLLYINWSFIKWGIPIMIPTEIVSYFEAFELYVMY